MRRRVSVGCGVLACAVARFALATGQPAPAHFGGAVNDLGLPSVGRILFGFLLTAGLAVAVAVGLRRFWPSLQRGKAASVAIRPVDRAAISATLTIHLVEIDGVRVAVAEGRTGVGITALPAAAPRLPDQRT